MGDKKFPNFTEYTYKKWYFWLIITLYSLWSGWEELINIYIGEFIMIVVAVIFIVSLFFLLSYSLTKATFKEMGYRNIYK